MTWILVAAISAGVVSLDGGPSADLISLSLVFAFAPTVLVAVGLLVSWLRARRRPESGRLPALADDRPDRGR